MVVTLPADIQNDIDAIARISAVPNILEVICRTTGMGFAAVARVTNERWIACAVKDEIAFGMEPGGELMLESTICHEIRQSGEPVVINCVAEDEVYFSHHTPAKYGFQSYISMPIVLKDGSFFGTLCAIDPKPHTLKTPETIEMFRLFAELISFHLNANHELEQSNSKLEEQRETAELREQFIAILGHDLRNPVGAVSNVAQLMLRMPLDDRMKRLATIIQDSSYRMKALIENILDFARGRLGEGIILNCCNSEQLETALTQVIIELRLIWPDHEIETDFSLTQAIYCDVQRIEQLFSNLLGNALSHGKKDTPVKVAAKCESDQLILTITNQGSKIPDEVMERLFHPFSRGDVKPGQQGLGLGLYIASEIARAHKGRITAHSNDDQTSFTLKIPAVQSAVTYGQLN